MNYNDIKFEYPIMYYEDEKEFVEIIGVIIDGQVYAVDVDTVLEDFPPMTTIKDKQSIKVILKGFFNTAIRMIDLNDVKELTPEQKSTVKVLYDNFNE